MLSLNTCLGHGVSSQQNNDQDKRPTNHWNTSGNGPRERNSAIISVDEKVFHKIQHSFMMKVKKKLRIEVTSLHNQGYHSIANIIFNGGNVEAFPSTSGRKQDSTFSALI